MPYNTAMSIPNPNPVYTRGKFVQVDYNDQTIKAMVTLASSNGRSLMLMFDGALHTPKGGLLAGYMPLLYEDDGKYRDLVEGAVATLKPA